MSDGPDQIEARRGVARGAWRRTGLALAGVACLAAAGGAGWGLSLQGWEEWRTVSDEPAADVRPGVAGMLALPVAAWGVWLLVRAVGGGGLLRSPVPRSRPIAMGRLSEARTGSEHCPPTPAGEALATRASMGTAFLVAYSVLSLVGAAGVHLAAGRLPGERTWLLAGGLAGVVVPLASLLAAGVYVDAARARGRPMAMGRLSQAREGMGGLSQAREGEEQAGPQVEETPRLGGLWAMALILVLGGLAVAGLCGFLAGRSAWEQWDALRRLSAGRGRILGSEVERLTVESPAGLVVRYRPRVRFFYRAGAAEHEGDRIAQGPLDFAEEARAEALARRYPRNLPVIVYYDPAAPEDGFLLPPLPLESPQWLVLAPLAAATGLLLAAWGAALPWGLRRYRRFLDSTMRLPWRIPSLGVLRESAEGLEVHRRRSALGGAWLGYAAVAGVIFVAASLRHRGTGEAMSMSGVVYGVVSCLCAAVACGLLASRKTGLRLVLDTEGRLLTAGNDRKAFRISFGDLAAWTVTWAQGAAPPGATASGAKGGSGRTPVLGIRTLLGQEARIHLFTGPASAPDRLAAAWKTAEELARLTGIAVADETR